MLAVLIQHDGLRDTPTTLKASQSVIIKAENTTDAACASKSKFCSPLQPRMLHSEELIQFTHSPRKARSFASSERARRNHTCCLFFGWNNFKPG